MKIGDRFTRATVTRIFQSADKRFCAECLCDCGKTYSTRQVNLLKGVSHGCRSCALKGKAGRKVLQKHENFLRRAERQYSRNAAQSSHKTWALTTAEFRSIFEQPCAYCGSAPANGIDRRDNALGYVFSNCAPCCKHCNYAKRDWSEAEFLAWVFRIAGHQGFSL